jgi:hypothetical protein
MQIWVANLKLSLLIKKKKINADLGGSVIIL